MKKLRNGVSVLMLGFVLATGVQPARAAAHDCTTALIEECAAAMDGEDWFTRWAIALICVGLSIGCA